MMTRFATLSLSLLLLFNLNAQINGFAKVQSISGSALTVNSPNETYGTFAVNAYVIVMQMQGADIGTNTTNTSTFGTLSAIGPAGLYEVRQITSLTRTSGILTSVTLNSALTNTYDPTQSLQVITYPTLGSGNYTTTAAINTLPWNGTIGGVTAFRVNGNLTLAHNISADGAGFRGGLKASGGGNACDASSYVCAADQDHGAKGEGIYLITNANYTNSKAKIVNGGGGGNLHNGGGAGGGNYSAGGNGGVGYNANGCIGGGFGGQNLNTYTSGSRIFMGGGGGGGQENNSLGSSGANGGGILLIKADSIIVTGTCGRSITTNGGNTPNSGNDGAGGAGAGGTIVLNVRGMRVQSTCPLTISSSGGSGGSCTDPSTHGGGGGGGQGAVIFSVPPTFANTTISTNPGTGGCNETGCTSRADSGTGPANSGIINSGSTPLPVSLLSFTAREMTHEVAFQWLTASESGNSHFNVQRSEDGSGWTTIATQPGAGNSTGVLTYHDRDAHPFIGLNYYRLEQVDFDGQKEYSQIEAIYFKTGVNTLHTYPNPVSEMLTVEAPAAIDPQSVVLTEISGKIIRAVASYPADNLVKIDMSALSAGYYQLSLISGGIPYTIPVVLSR